MIFRNFKTLKFGRKMGRYYSMLQFKKLLNQMSRFHTCNKFDTPENWEIEERKSLQMLCLQWRQRELETAFHQQLWIMSRSVRIKESIALLFSFLLVNYMCTNGFWNHDLILNPILILSDIIVFENKTTVKIRGQLLQLWKWNVILLLILSAKSNVHLYRLIIIKRFVVTKDKMTQHKKVNKEES